MKLDKSVTETLEMLREAFGEHSLSRTAVTEWHPQPVTGIALTFYLFKFIFNILVISGQKYVNAFI
jgi:succinate dehydrogenase hydrophobic anchor subunit